MAKLRYGEKTFVAEQGETVLDCMLRNGEPVPYSCRSGVCQSCLLRATEGAPPPESQRGLKDAWREQGFFLSCQARPAVDLVVTKDAIASEAMEAWVEERELLSPTVLRLRLVPERPLRYRAGQFLNLMYGEDLVRSYSLASLPEEESFLELHVRLVPSGRMSSALKALRVGDSLRLRGPAGECFYVEGKPEQPILLAGSGTGLAPLYGIVRDALRRGHSGKLVLIHGARNPEGLYLVDTLRKLAGSAGNFSYVPCVLDQGAGATADSLGVEVGSLQALIAQRFPSLSGWRVFLCGDAELVNSLRRQVFLAGASRRDIAADPFVMATPAAKPG
jgi:NAD(P)H-flavin reductase